jgi:hypothetical protein
MPRIEVCCNCDCRRIEFAAEWLQQPAHGTQWRHYPLDGVVLTHDDVDCDGRAYSSIATPFVRRFPVSIGGVTHTVSFVSSPYSLSHYGWRVETRYYDQAEPDVFETYERGNLELTVPAAAEVIRVVCYVGDGLPDGGSIPQSCDGQYRFPEYVRITLPPILDFGAFAGFGNYNVDIEHQDGTLFNLQSDWERWTHTGASQSIILPCTGQSPAYYGTDEIGLGAGMQASAPWASQAFYELKRGGWPCLQVFLQMGWQRTLRSTDSPPVDPLYCDDWYWRAIARCWFLLYFYDQANVAANGAPRVMLLPFESYRQVGDAVQHEQLPALYSDIATHQRPGCEQYGEFRWCWDRRLPYPRQPLLPPNQIYDDVGDFLPRINAPVDWAASPSFTDFALGYWKRRGTDPTYGTGEPYSLHDGDLLRFKCPNQAAPTFPLTLGNPHYSFPSGLSNVSFPFTVKSVASFTDPVDNCRCIDVPQPYTGAPTLKTTSTYIPAGTTIVDNACTLDCSIIGWVLDTMPQRIKLRLPSTIDMSTLVTGGNCDPTFPTESGLAKCNENYNSFKYTTSALGASGVVSRHAELPRDIVLSTNCNQWSYHIASNAGGCFPAFAPFQLWYDLDYATNGGEAMSFRYEPANYPALCNQDVAANLIIGFVDNTGPADPAATCRLFTAFHVRVRVESTAPGTFWYYSFWSVNLGPEFVRDAFTQTERRQAGARNNPWGWVQPYRFDRDSFYMAQLNWNCTAGGTGGCFNASSTPPHICYCDISADPAVYYGSSMAKADGYPMNQACATTCTPGRWDYSFYCLNRTNRSYGFEATDTRSPATSLHDCTTYDHYLRYCRAGAC